MDDLRASRFGGMVAILVAAMMVGSPAAILGNSDYDPVGAVSAADGTRVFVLGVPTMTVATLNPHTSTMVTEYMIIFPLYSYLLQWDQAAQNVIGDLAKSWTVSPDGLTYEFELVDTAYFVVYDPDNPSVPTKGPQVTSEDVKWSIDTVAVATNSRLNSIWPVIDGQNIIESTWTDGPLHFGISIRKPFVPFEESLMSNPIFPKYIWDKVSLLGYKNLPFVGSGAFFYKSNVLPDSGYATLARNPYWYGETSYGWQLHVDEFVMKRYDDEGTMWNDVRSGAIDAAMGIDPGVFHDAFGGDTPPANLLGFHQSNGFVYEFNLNQMTDANRKLWGGSYTKGSNSQLLLNHSVKKAISMCVDRTYLIQDSLFGYGSFTNTLVPEQNIMSHNYGEDGHDCILDPGVTGPAMPDPFDPIAARMLLWDAGWRWDAAGGDPYEKTDPAFLDVVPLYNGTGTDRQKLEFRFATLNTDTDWESMARDIMGWCDEAGIKLNLELHSVAEMNSIWYAANYDLWLWDWVLTPTAEAVSGVLYLFTTSSVPADSDVYLSDPLIDSLYYKALGEMDFNARKELCYQIQDLVYLNRGCQALAFREDLYAFNTLRWENFGDLNNTYLLLPDVWPVWLCMNMEPRGNSAPRIGDISVSYDTDVPVINEDVTFTAINVVDDLQLMADLNLTWIVGFGGQRFYDHGPTLTHQFTSDGVYSITLVAKETVPNGGHADYLSSYKTIQVTVHDFSNAAPHNLAFAASPNDPTAGEVVTFTGSAVDDEGDTLYYTWDFGDGSSGIGPVVTHQFPADGAYTVTMMVDDHRFGVVGSRPATKSQLMAVGPNHPPWISVPDYGSISVKTEQTFTVQAGDMDPRDVLRYTWNWGDGTTSVTATPSAKHSYQWRDEYEITVYADDLTGLPGHNVSDKGTVHVIQTGNNIPVVVVFEVNKDEAFLGETLTFTAVAVDGDGDPLTFTFDFDDGTTEEESFGGTSPNDPVECIVEKAYTVAGTYSVYLYVTDGVATATSAEVPVTVGSNMPPVIEAFDPAAYWDTGVSMTFSVLATDPDGDDLTYTWDWDDGTTSQTTIGSTTHVFAESGTYTVGVTVDDGKGRWDYAEADVTVNRVPYITAGLQPRAVDEDAPYTYTVTAIDGDGDALNYLWDFGDGTPYVMTGPNVEHTYADQGAYTCTVYVWDDFVAHRPTHNVSSAATITVKDPSEDWPPDVAPLSNVMAIVGEELEFMVYAVDDKTEVLRYTWDFDDGSALLVALPPVTHTYLDEGTYTLTVWVDDLTGNNVSVQATVMVGEDQPPIADAGGDRTTPEDVPVFFTGKDSLDYFPIPSDGYAWTVNDVDGPEYYDTMEFYHTFYTPGEYTVSLVVTDSIGQESEPDVITVTVTDETPPTADAGDDQTVHVGSLVQFEGSGEDEYDSDLTFTWAFYYNGQIRTLSGETPTYTFAVIGVYTVELTVSDSAGNEGTDKMILTVADLVDPVADAGDDQAVDVGDTVTFDGSGSYDDDTLLVSYEWAFEYDGEEEKLTGETAEFTFDIAGVYVVTLTVEDEGGNTASDTVTITVLGGENEPPVADAGDDATIAVGTTHTFDGSGSSDDVVNYTWTFVHGANDVVLYGVSPSFLFGTAGTYVVTLNVTDEEGLWDTDTVTITVEVPNAAPVADAGQDQKVKVGATVTFDGSGSSDSDGTIVSYQWTFTYDGQTQTLSGVSPTFEFAEAGEYTVTLTVTDDDGATDTDTVVITVEEGGSFLGTYGLPIAIAVVVIIALVAAMMLLKGRKGGSKGAEVPPPEQG